MQAETVALSAAIAEIYDAAVDPSRWQKALGVVCEFVGGAQASMFWQGMSPDQVNALYLYNDDPHYTKLYLEKLAPFNPAFPAVLFEEVGTVHAFSDLVPIEEERQTILYKEWVAPQGFTDSLTVVLERDASRIALLSFPWRNGAIDQAARARLALLVPHLQRAVAIGRLFVQQKATETLLTDALDRMGEAVFLLAGDGQVVFSNASGRRLIDEGKLLQMRSGRLSAVRPEAERALDESVRAIRSGAPIGTQGATIALDEMPAARWKAHLLPLMDGARRGASETHYASAALFVRQSHFADPTPLEMLAKTYRLTASEIRVVDAMLRVSGRDAIAAALGVSDATVKTHLNHIYRKCGIKNQSDLIKLVMGQG